MNKIAIDSIDLIKNNIEKLKELFPNIVTDGKIDFDVLKTMLGEDIETSNEKYQFNWNGKKESIKTAYAQSTTTLRPCKEKSKEWDSTENLYIEGDNLEVLKQLQKTYFGKIKFIYIDPPYNTGNDFIYHDNFQQSLDNYKIQTNTEYHSNPNTSGRFHSDWCSMIYPRLLLARNLLSDDGAIFISIDDNEIANLLKIGDEIFGSYRDILIWNKEADGKSGTLKSVTTTRRIHEYVVCYFKNISKVQFAKIREALKGREDEFQTANLAVNSENENPNHPNYFSITNPLGDVFTRQWKWDKEYIAKLIEQNLIYWGKDGHKQPRLIIPTDERRLTFIQSILNYGGTTIGRKDFEKLLPSINFSYPKPIVLLYKLLSTATNKDSIILDFFSGSASTAHAVMQLNADDNGNRKFIMVQLPEQCEESSEACKDEYKTICDIGEERIRRAGDNIKQEWIEKHLSTKNDIFSTTESQQDFPVDIGFKVFTLDSSNIIPWDNTNQYDEKSLV